MKTWTEQDDRVIAMTVRIPNRAEYGVPVPAPAPSVDVPASWQWDTDDAPEAAQNHRYRTIRPLLILTLAVCCGAAYGVLLTLAYGAGA